MNTSNFIAYFITGGLFTAVIIALEESGYRILSGFATLIPVFTLIAYFFIGQTQGGEAVGQHAKFVLVGTLLSWVPYMIVVAYLSPVLGPRRAIFLGLFTFFVLALSYITAVNRLGFFR